MGTPVSPGIYLNELDLSSYAAALGGTVTAILGGATKGPLDTPTRVSSEPQLTSIFGQPLESDAALRAAIQVLRSGGIVLFTRVAVSAIAASVGLTSTSGGVTAVAASGTVVLAAQPADGNTVTISDGSLSKVFEFKTAGPATGSNLLVVIGADATASALALSVAINGAAFGVTSTPTGLSLALVNSVASAVGNVAVTKVGANITVTGMAGGVTLVAPTVTALATVSATSKGTWANGLQILISPTLWAGAPSGNFDLSVLDVIDNSGTFGVVEKYTNVSLDSASDRYAVTAINAGLASVGVASTLISLALVANGRPTNGTKVLASGNSGISGIVPSTYVGTVNGTVSTGLKALRNAERVEFNTLLVPGVSHDLVIQEMIALCEKRGDAIALLDAPFGLTVQGVIDWHNGTSSAPNAPTAQLNSSYAALYYPWVQITDPYLNKPLWLPPSVFVAGKFAETDATAGYQFAVAGVNRGMLGQGVVEYSPDQDDRDLLQGSGNHVNPIVNFAAFGPTIYGNRTLQRKPTKLDEVKNRRMLNFIKKLVATAAVVFPFEPNDSASWDKFKLAVDPILSNLRDKRGLVRFAIKLDGTTTTDALKANKRARAILVMEPEDTLEALSIDFAIVSSGVTFSA